MAAVLGAAHGASYTVGAPAGSWDLRTNYTRWASGISFRAGDQLVFKYSPGAHDVVEVSKADHDSCSNARPLATFTTGDDTVPLPAGGATRYFICGVPGHCAGGMKLAVRVEAAAAGAPNAAAPSPAPVAMAPRGARTPTAAPSPAPVAMAPRAARPPMATPGARAPAAGSLLPAVPPSSSATASAGVGSLVCLGLGAAVAALMALY
ncbi:hypothetical protein BAE44_0020780 [Dichanthelium oligosanthes]|uniref:Phytocyanin domain-containing protein n=1 Tax=Dichanthelium oligosanthes TaxID=888268 RepID=A0A1E5UZA1_9POAL|nr:hypothetical protein BAE44_0020780 [Dichanthelium oligosanthes]